MHFTTFFCLFRPFPEGAKSTWEIQISEEKGLFPQISSDLLKPPSLKPPFAALQENRNEGTFGCSPGTKTGTRVHSDDPPERKPERGYIRMFPRNENRSEGMERKIFETGTRAHSPKPPLITKPPFGPPVNQKALHLVPLMPTQRTPQHQKTLRSSQLALRSKLSIAW